MSNRSDFSWNIAFFVIALILVAVFELGMGSITGPDATLRAAEAQGYTHIKITGKAKVLVGVRGCSKGDAARYDVQAVNPAGKTVEFSVCDGPLKGATIRF